MNNLNNLILQLKKESENNNFVIVKKTKININILKFLYDKKYIEMFQINNYLNLIKIYFNHTSFKFLNFKFISLISKPGNKIYSPYKKLFKYGKGTVVSTSKGLKQISELKKNKFKLGGEIFFYLKKN